MSHWTQTPDQASETQQFRIYRTPVGKTVELTILSTTYVGAKLHYWRGRSTPCGGTDCQACREGQRPRWKGYVLALHRPTKTIVIFEFTDRGWRPMEDALKQRQSLRGLPLTATRLNRKPNGPIQLCIGETREESPHLPAEVDLREMLDRMWEIRQRGLEFTDEIE